MPVSITVRNVPDEVRNELASRAARAGLSMQEYLLRELASITARPSLEDVLDRARARVASSGIDIDVAQILAFRDEDRR